jgi:prephenate dehydrogenase
MMTTQQPSLLIIGAGLLGASIGLKWRSVGGTVYVRDISPTAQAIAADLGAGRPWTEREPAPDVVVVSTPPEVTAPAVVRALRDFPEAVVTDVASIKQSVVRAVEDSLREEGRLEDLERFVPGHPMAGRERSGPVAARAELFEAMPWIVCPSGSDQATAIIETLAGKLGGTVLRMSPREHDDAVALISHLPQIAASLVAARLSDGPETALRLAGNGLKDTTRIADSDPHLWVQILSGNAGPIERVLKSMHEGLSQVLESLRNPERVGSRLTLARLFDDGNAGRARIPGKHGAAAQHFAHVVVLLDDRPGQLGMLFAILADLEINVEDVRMEHAAGRDVGAVELSVLPHLGQKTADELSARGHNAYYIS